jgi:hypothetical protein
VTGGYPWPADAPGLVQIIDFLVNGQRVGGVIDKATLRRDGLGIDACGFSSTRPTKLLPNAAGRSARRCAGSGASDAAPRLQHLVAQRPASAGLGVRCRRPPPMSWGPPGA